MAGIQKIRGQPSRNKAKGAITQDPGAKVQNMSVILKTATKS